MATTQTQQMTVALFPQQRIKHFSRPAMVASGVDKETAAAIVERINNSSTVKSQPGLEASALVEHPDDPSMSVYMTQIEEHSKSSFKPVYDCIQSIIDEEMD